MLSTRSIVAFVVSFACAFALTARSLEAQSHPNILLFIGDDIDFSYYGFQGHGFAHTPNLDQLANEGVVFENGYATASVCGASLRSLLAGIRSYTWERMRDEIVAVHPGTPASRVSQHVPFTLPRLLRQAGYTSFAGGKMSEGNFIDAGFDAGTMVVPPFFIIDGAAEFGRDSMQELYDFIDAQSGPWFAWVAPMLPHGPFDPPEDLRALYSELGLIDQAVDFFGNLSRMDQRVGEIRAFLDDRGLTDNTVVIYVADNGWEQPLYPPGIESFIGGDRGKLSVHDRGFHSPIIVRWPAEVLPGRRTDRLVTFEDVFETILDYAGAPSHDCTGGASFRRVADDGRGPWRRRRVLLRMSTVRYPTEEFLASHLDDDPDNDLPVSDQALGLYFRSGRRWAYSSVLERGVEELYDLRNDPMGLADLSEVRRGRVRGLRRRALRLNEKLEALRCPVQP